MQWVEPPVLGDPPGPCNMHTSDFFPSRRQIIVFRGGDGKEYLNDLHGLNVDSLQWERLECTGVKPEARANHCSAVMDHSLFIFGGWNGQTRLNDVHVLDTNTLVWRRLEPRGVPPPPRAGMTLTRIRDRLFLFGGSGPAAKVRVYLRAQSSRTFADVVACPSLLPLPVLRNVTHPPSLPPSLPPSVHSYFTAPSKCFDDLQILDLKEMCW